MLNPYIDTYNTSKIRIKFDGSFLNRFPPTIFHDEIVNIYIVYEISDYYSDINYPTLENRLFGSVKLTENEIGLDLIENDLFHILPEEQVETIIFGVDMSSSAKIDNRKKDILILDKGPTQGLEHTLSAEKMYSINFTKKIQNFV